MTKILVLISAVIFFTACTVKTTEKLTDVRHPYGVFIGAEKEKLLSLNNYDVLVIDAELLTAENIDVIHQNGNNEIYSYLYWFSRRLSQLLRRIFAFYHRRIRGLG